MDQADPFPQLLGGKRGRFDAWDHPQTIAAARYVVDRLESFGLKVPASSRLRLAMRDLERIECFDVSLGHGDLATERLVAESTRTIAELYAIVKQIQPPDALTKARLRAVLGGKPVPTFGEHDPARDVQAELFAAVMLLGAGFQVRADEPDLMLWKAGREIPVAVKRITSDRNFEKRMREARDQLARTGTPGYIVVSADQFLAACYEQDTGVDFSSAHYRKLAELTDNLHLDPVDSPVLGVFAISTSFRHVRGSRRDMKIGLHFHQRFVTFGIPERLAAAEAAGAVMAESLAVAICNTFGKDCAPAT